MGKLYGKVLFPLYHLLKNDGVNRACQELQRNQWLSADELNRIQQRKLARLLSFAFQHVPYYRSLRILESGDVGKSVSPAVLRKLPILTKDLIRSNQTSLVSENLDGNALFDNSTSGSTGEPVRFYTDAFSRARRTAAEIRSDSLTGWQLGDPLVRLWGAPMDLRHSRTLRTKIRRIVSKSRTFDSADLSATTMDQYFLSIRKLGPRLLIGYPGPLEQFALHCESRGVALPTLTAIVSSAETLWPHQRLTIERAFRVPVFDRYGSREFGQIASECELHTGLHISSDRICLEILDDNGMPCPVGVPGRIVLTDLDNFGMPLVRYDIGDRGAIDLTQNCDCGRGLPFLERVEGRTMDIVQTPDGNKLGGTFWTLLLRSRPGIRQMQVVQEAIDGVVINYIRDEDLDSDTLMFFERRIKEACGQDFVVEFREQDSIQLTVSGKQRIVVSKIATENSPAQP